MVENTDEVLAVLGNLDFPKIFSEIVKGNIPDTLKASCQSPRAYFVFRDEISRRFADTEGWVPLWESNRDFIKIFDVCSGLFFECSLEDFSCKVIAKNYQQFVTYFFLELIYAGEWDRLKELSDIFSYDYLRELVLFAEGFSGDNYLEESREFIDKVGAKGAGDES